MWCTASWRTTTTWNPRPWKRCWCRPRTRFPPPGPAQKLEEIANSFDGVEKCYAIQSGREVRIMVKPEDVTDEGIKVMAREIAKRIEEQMEYPGQIRVNVIRETRSTEYAK